MKAHTMIPIHPVTRRRNTTLSALCVLSLLLAVGCSNPKVAGPRTESPEQLTMGDFIAEDATASAKPEQSESMSSAPTSSRPNEAVQAAFPNDGITLANSNDRPRQVEIPSPTINTDSSNSSSQPSTRSLQLLDAKVGDVNGKPIFTSSFFEPIEERLIAEAGRLQINDWRPNAGAIIAQRLDGIILDELFRAEALAALSPTQRVGLQAFLSNFRSTILSENLGSSQLASRRIQEREGMTLDQALRQKEVDTLVQLTLIREINRRVNVSWRDIEQQYEREIDRFSPPPTAVLLVIRAFKDETDKIDQIKSGLETGQSFDEIAASPLNNYKPETLGEQRVLLEGTFEETSFFGPDALNEATRGLTLGQWTGPVELSSSVYWIMLSDMEQETVSLYDAQLVIQRELNQQRREEAKQQYFERLQSRARVSTRDQVLMRLFEIADQRYAPNR